jgi:hypothetical protein
MDTFTKNDLHTLIEEQDEPCISIFIPTHKKGSEVLQDPIRLKNQLRAVEKELEGKGHNEKDINKMLEPARNLLSDTNTLNHLNEGLALFISKDKFHYYKLPAEFEEHHYVNNAFQIKPIIPYMAGNTNFYILALDQNNTKLYRADRYKINEIKIPNAPTSLSEALKYDEPQEQVQHHTATSGAQKGGYTGKNSALFHGHGTGGNDDAKHKKDVERFFKMLDKGVHDILKNQSSPLLLMGIDYEIALYREASSYNNVLENSIASNPEGFSESELHCKAWAIAGDYFDKERLDALSKYRELITKNQASDNIEDIIKAIYAGRVEALFVEQGKEIFGTFKLEEYAVEVHPAEQPEDEDLLNHAVIQTLLHDGRVYCLEKEFMPSDTSIAAVYRY